MSKIYPTIEFKLYDTITFGERKFMGNKHEIVTIIRPLDVNFDTILSSESEAFVSRKIFSKENFRFDIDDGRSASVDIYIEDTVKDQFRIAYIQDIIKDHAAWFFTYGERIKEGKDE